MKYKCKDCEHVFESDQTVFECPQCGKPNIISVETFWNKYKKPIIIASVIIALLLMLKICSSDGTTVKVEYNTESHKLEVELEGEKVNQYKIIVTRDGSELSTKLYKDKPVNFSFDIPGEYRLQVKFTGNGEMPQLSPYKKGPWSIEKPEPPKVPQILEVKILSTDTKTKTYSVKIITDVNVVPMTDTEFSVDNSTYQSSDVFNLRPGFYTFYARNMINDSIGTSKMNLPDIVVKEPITDVELNKLLRKIANGDTDAFNRWRKEVDGVQPLPVSGVQFISNSYELAQDAITQNKVYIVRTQRDNNGRILRIIV